MIIELAESWPWNPTQSGFQMVQKRLQPICNLGCKWYGFRIGSEIWKPNHFKSEQTPPPTTGMHWDSRVSIHQKLNSENCSAKKPSTPQEEGGGGVVWSFCQAAPTVPPIKSVKIKTCFAKRMCSLVWGIVPSSAETKRMAPSIWLVPEIMFLMKSLWPEMAFQYGNVQITGNPKSGFIRRQLSVQISITGSLEISDLWSGFWMDFKIWAFWTQIK